ncbi:hypothetical protein DFO70_103119 [Cytobacillus firmus]|uniref:Uncharacterized protein n=2 Tax=Cytobacillus TaxID=2675230 RepID=A0A366K014_CYTFI|nr:hypothetical protein DFO70_103119 [Cytobacillus firmus]TDX43930.1 hypothetical protein DFO72_104132 [Cytobacillus oceanisediminis]
MNHLMPKAPQDAGHADIVSGRGAISLRSLKGQSPPHFGQSLPKRQTTPFREARLVLVGGGQGTCAFLLGVKRA